MSGELSDVSVWAVLAATVGSLVVGMVYYGALGERLAALSDSSAVGAQPPPWKLAVELLRGLAVAAVVAGLAAIGGVEGVAGGVCLALALWAAFPAVLLTGSVIWEDVNPRLAALHSGDWLAKLLLVAIVVSVWRG